MSMIVEGATDWRGPDIADGERWITRLDAAQLDEIRTAYEHFRGLGMPLKAMTAEDFPLPTLSGVLAGLREALEGGLGHHLYRGFPVEGWAVNELRAVYWGLCRHVGSAISQSKRGDVLGDVRDIGTDVKGPEGRGYTSREKLEFHTDSTDVTGLFCLKTAKSGGHSFAVSSVAVHKEIARRRPDLLDVLYAPFIWNRQGQQPEGEPPTYEQPLYGTCEGRFTCRYIRTHIEAAPRFAGAPPLSPEQIEALDLVDAIGADPAFHLSFDLEPGDMWFLNNHVTCHARTGFEDWDEPTRKRHLLRIWLSVPNSRPLPESFSAIYRDRRPGAVRGGFPGHVEEPVFTTLPLD